MLVALGCALALPAHAQDAMQGTDMSMPPQSAEQTRSADYSDGYRYGPTPGMSLSDDGMLDGSASGMFLLDQLEYAHDDGGGDHAFVDGEAWYGRDFDKLWLKFEGRSGESLRTEALWDHAIAAFWDMQLGVRNDSGNGPNRTWAAFGVQGLAPYHIETEATIYIGGSGRSAARVQMEYDALLTQRLILQPKFEMNLYGKSDPQRGIGSGLSDAELGLRLRYEVTRQFAPYIGITWQRRYGRSTDFADVRGARTRDTQFVAGVRVWF
jgi:copper resistance protein B